MQRPLRTASLLFSVTLLTGCFTLTDYDNLDDSRQESFTLPYVQNLEGFDILFVVDNSESTDGMLSDMGEMAPGMLGSLDFAMENAQGYGPRLHIGVITPNLGVGQYNYLFCEDGGDRGELQTITGSGCPELVGTHIVVVDNVVQNMGWVTDISQAVQCLIDGQRERDPGCGFEQPLAAVAKALDVQQTPSNAGFIRDGAGLAVVLMTDEDDCSAATDAVFDPNNPDLGIPGSFRCFEWGVICDEDVRTPGQKTNCRPRTEAEGGLLYEPEELAAMIFASKSQTDMVFATVAQPADPVVVALNNLSEPYVQSACGTDGMPGVRLQAFLSQFGDFGLEDSMCAPQLPDLLWSISERMASQAVSRCMPKTPADRDKSTDGLQAECTAWDVLNLGQINEQRSADIRSCDDTGDIPPCWRIHEDRVCTSDYKLEVLRAEDPPPGSIVEATCWVMLD